MHDKMVLGDNLVYSMDCKKTQINNNLLVVGTTGCGKTMSVTEPNLLATKNASIVTTFAKRRLVDAYIGLFKERGYETIDINFANPEASAAGYDPMDYVRGYNDVSYLAHAIVMADQRKESSHADPYWDEVAISLLSALIGCVYMVKKNPSMLDVLNLFYDMEMERDGEGIMTAIDVLFEMLEKKRPHSFAGRMWKAFHACPYRTASCVVSSLSAALDMTFSGELCEVMKKRKKLSFQEISERRTAVFITTSPVNSSLNTFINIFYSQMFKELFDYGERQASGRLKIPVRIICDDFACGASIPGFQEYISICREKNISVTALLQSESQLYAIYGEYAATTIINNMDTYLYLGGNDIRTARNVSERLNAPLEDILYMPVGKEIVFRRGEKGPIVANRYDILSDREYQNLYQSMEKER